jgi:hypothetical protein
VPRTIRLAVTVQAVVLTYGGVVHVVQVVSGGWPPYAWAPPWLAVYFTALTVFDFVAASLLLARRSVGLRLAVVIFLSDAAANWYATYRVLDPTAAAQVAQAVISVLALASLIIARCARPWMSRPLR